MNGLNQYLSAGPASFTHDANGNLTSDGSVTFVYDIENRLVSAGGATNVTLRYDPLGRLYETVPGAAVGTTRFLYDGDELVAEYNAAGAMLRRYLHGANVDDPIAWYEGPGFTQMRGLHANHQGSIVLVKEAGVGVIGVNSYDEYGIPGAANIGRFQYTGQIWLPELGMYYYKARIYSPTLGRFLQTDPIGYEDQINLYAYVGNDLVNNTDPDGKQREGLLGAVIDFVIEDYEKAWNEPSLSNVAVAIATTFKPIKVVDKVVDGLGVAKKAGAERIAANAAQGAKAETQTAERLGARVAGRRVTLESTTGRRSVTDFVTKDKGVVETKSGGSPLRPGQRDVKADIDAGRPVTPRGQNARNAGLEPGKPTTMKCYQVDRCQ